MIGTEIGGRSILFDDIIPLRVKTIRVSGERVEATRARSRVAHHFERRLHQSVVAYNHNPLQDPITTTTLESPRDRQPNRAAKRRYLRHRPAECYSYRSASAIGMLDACRDGMIVINSDAINAKLPIPIICSHGM